MAISLIVASSDEHFRSLVRESLVNIPNTKVISEYPEVTPNLYIRVLQDLERHPESALLVDLAGEGETLKALEKTKQAAPDLYVIAANYSADGETVIATLRAGANDFLLLPLKRVEFRESIGRLERAPRRTGTTASKLGKLYTFIGTKGGCGTTTLAVNFASVLAQRKQSTVLVDLDWVGNDVAMHVGAAPQHTLAEVAENLGKLDQALFEGFVTRDPLGFFRVGPPDGFDHRGFFSEPMFRDFSAFLVEKYDSVVIDAGRDVGDEVVLSALQSSSLVFLVITQEFPAVRNAQRYISHLMRIGMSQDQIRLVVNHYSKKGSPHHATLDQIQQTLNQPVFYGIPHSPAVLAAINKARPLVADRQAFPEMDKVFRAFVDKATGAKPANGKSQQVNA